MCPEKTAFRTNYHKTTMRTGVQGVYSWGGFETRLTQDRPPSFRGRGAGIAGVGLFRETAIYLKV